jgi:protein phosphatase
VVYAGRSDTGRKRSVNQDRWAAHLQQRLYVVADGIAGSSNGALAAEMVVELLPTYIGRHFKAADLDDAGAPELLRRAIAELSDDLYARGRSDLRIGGATSTVVAALVTGSHALIVHLGDSRAYLFRDMNLRRLTGDHSMVQELIDRGEVAAEDAAGHPSHGVVTRYVGMAPPALPDISGVDLQPGDRILLCSDGLHGVIDDETLANILAAHPDPDQTAEELIAAANDVGGPDNITAVVIDIPVGSTLADAETVERWEVS